MTEKRNRFKQMTALKDRLAAEADKEHDEAAIEKVALSKPFAEAMAIFDPMGVAMDWLDAYCNVSAHKIVAMYGPKAVIDCGCGTHRFITGPEHISAYLLDQMVEYPSLGLHDIWMEGESEVGLAFRTDKGVVRAVLQIAPDGKITRSCCGFKQ